MVTRSSLRSFYKALRKKERLYCRKNAEKIESLKNVNHKEFRSEINKLGPQKTGQIPNKVYGENRVVSDTDVVLNGKMIDSNFTIHQILFRQV